MAKRSMPRVVVSGCGWVTPSACGTIDEVLAAVAAAPAASTDGYLAVPDDPPIADISHLGNELKRDKGAWMSAVAIEEACRTAALPLEALDDDRAGLALGCGLAGQLGMINFATEVRQQSVRFVSPIHFPQTVGNYVAGAIARAYKLRGPNATFAGGPASSLEALIEARSWVARGEADVVLAGGFEQLTAELAAGFGGGHGPLSEGACFLVVESADRSNARSVAPLAELVGTDGTHDDPAKRPLVSTAGHRHTGAIRVEQATGLCVGAAGAAATAAAIGAAHGRPIPRDDDGPAPDPRPGAIDLARLTDADGRIRATIRAGRESSSIGECIRLDLRITVSASRSPL